YPHLRVVISSATIDIEEFKEAFEAEGISVGILDLSETLDEVVNYKVHFWGDGAVEGCDCWFCQRKGMKLGGGAKPPTEDQLPEVVADLVIEILKGTDAGGILVFLPGEEIIENAKALIEEQKKGIDPGDEILIVPIYRRLGEDEVAKRFDRRGEKRRVLLTTDIAETSHTLGDIVYVVDSGYVKESQWDPKTQIASLPIVRCSQARCKQRWGRVGREQKGYAYYLYTRTQFEEFEAQTSPEIFRSPLEDVILNLKAAGIRDVENFGLIGEAREKEEVKSEIGRALKAIKEEGFVDERGNVTEKGLELFYVPFSAPEKALLDLADEQNCLVEAATALSMMKTEEGEPRTGPGLYSPQGLLLWDSRWTARTKRDVWRVHQALKVGCRDDLDFVVKLAICFLKAKYRHIFSIEGDISGFEGELDRGIVSERLRNSYLFSIEGDIERFEAEFNRRKVPDELWKSFKERGSPLKRPRIRKLAKGEWLIEDEDKFYLLRKEDDRLNAYENRLPLSKEAEVEKVNETEWLVRDRDRIYIVKREIGKLHIYRNLAKEWADRHFVNYEVLEAALAKRDELIEIYRIKTREEVREIRLELLDRVRALMATVLTDRTVKLKGEDPLFYENERYGGIISEYCVGNWSEGDRAILVMSAKERRVLEGRIRLIPVAAFMVRFPEEGWHEERMFADQRFPVGSWVSVRREGDGYLISDIVQPPPPIDVAYKRKLTFGMLLEDFLRVDCPPTVYFKEELLDDELRRMIPQARVVWIDGRDREHEEARIVEWKEMDGEPCAVVAPIDELMLLAELRGEKRRGDKLAVRIERVMRDPYGRRGWILSRTREGLEIPIEMRDMAISLWEPFKIFGYSLEELEGEWLELHIRDFDLMGRPKLSNLARVIQDLEEIRKETRERGEFQIEGRIEDIKEAEKKVVVACHRGLGVVHFFEVGVHEWEIPYLHIGEKVKLSLSLREDESVYRYHPLLNYEIESLPEGWKYNEGKIFFPYCLKESAAEEWEAPEEVLEDVYRSSWHYLFQGKIISREPYAVLKEGDRVQGKVVEKMRYKDSDRIAGVRVEVKVKNFLIPGFVPLRELKWSEEEGFWRIPEEDDVLDLEVLSSKGTELILRERADREGEG
ncbi:MAG: hypothetical protein DRO11_06795, partial [Methanobacteriota archaeon]